jgi:ATP-dependent DNA helicase DinG
VTDAVVASVEHDPVLGRVTGGRVVDRVTREGRSAFSDHALPEAAVSLKQGAGRLIRRESDRGALVVCDNRLVSTGYGRRLLANLPPMHRVQTLPELLQALAGLTKTDTNAC